MIRLLEMSFSVGSSAFYPEIPQTFCLSAVTIPYSILVLMQDILQVLFFSYYLNHLMGRGLRCLLLCYHFSLQVLRLILFTSMMKISSLNEFNIGCCFQGNSK